MITINNTRIDTNPPENPSDSILMTLARAAMASDASAADVTWPSLDLNDPKQRAFGDYELLEEIGRGGMGVVYRARQRSLDRDVAIKFIASGIADSFNVARFLGEARAAARLMHPNIVPVHEVGSIDGVHYFSMALVKGRTLASMLDERPLAEPAILQLMLKLCDAIDYAHRLGLLHLDLKPANVLLDERGEPLIADFGLARHMDANGGVDTQEVSGTPSFMAPEQILIKQYRLTPATDLYALGAILYRALTGVSPHGVGAPDEMTQRAISGRIRAPRDITPGISADLAAVVMKSLELLPKDRYASVAQLTDDLRRIRDGLPVSVRKIGLLERAQRWFQREPKLAFASAFAVGALLLGAVGTSWQWQQAAAARDRAAIAGEIGARLFSYDGEEDKRSADLLSWLSQRLPGDEERQAAALTAFVASVDAESRADLDSLLNGIIDALGGAYRRDMIRSLEASSAPRHQLYAAMLAWNDEFDSADPKTFAASLQAAIADDPSDPLTWHVAAVFCPGPANEAHCLHPQAAETLTRLVPDNMYAWLLLAMAATDPPQAVAALHEAAKRTKIDDYLGPTMAEYAKAVEMAGVKAPALIARPAQLLAPNEAPEASIAQLESLNTPIPNWHRLADLCGVRIGSASVTDPELLADCLVIGERMVHSQGGIMTQMWGAALVRNLAKGTPAAEEAIRKRQLLQYLQAMTNSLTPAQHASYSPARQMQDMAEIGEFGAWQRRIKALGLPEQLPSGWQPEDPASSLSSRERQDNVNAAFRAARTLLAQADYDGAIATLKTIESPTGFRSKSDSDNAQFFVAYGKAHTGLGQFVAAQRDLIKAWKLASDFGPGSRIAIECAQAMVELYTAWDAAEPGRGHAAKTDRFRTELALLIRDDVESQ